MRKGKKIARMVARRLKDVPTERQAGEKNNHVMHVPGSQNLHKGSCGKGRTFGR